MRILIAHVRYRHYGGEDAVADTEARILREAGHDVMLLAPASADFDTLPSAEKVRIALSAGVHAYGRALIGNAIAEFRPDVVHFHNLYPLLGTGAMLEARAQGCGVVQTYHNYRTSCLAGTHVLRGETCERCSLGRFVPGIVRGCYRGSRFQSVAMAMALRIQGRALADVPDVVMPLTEFAAERLVSQGVPRERLVVKPNSVDAGHGPGFEARTGVLYVGRLSAEKGIRALVEEWPGDGPILTVVGGGPEGDAIAAVAAQNSRVVMRGQVGPSAVREALRAARVLVVPSVAFEGMPLVILEALAEGTPVICRDVGGLAEVVGHEAAVEGDVRHLTVAVINIHDERTEWERYERDVTSRFRSRFSHVGNVERLLGVYATALHSARGVA